MKKIIIALVVIVVGYYLFFAKSSRPVYSGQDTIAVYVTQRCPYCKKALQQLDSARVRYIAYDVEKDATAYRRFKELKGNGVPVIEANGQVIHGYNRALIAQLATDPRYRY